VSKLYEFVLDRTYYIGWEIRVWVSPKRDRGETSDYGWGGLKLHYD